MRVHDGILGQRAVTAPVTWSGRQIEGEITAFCATPMVRITDDSGEKHWMSADLVEPVDPKFSGDPVAALKKLNDVLNEVGSDPEKLTIRQLLARLEAVLAQGMR